MRALIFIHRWLGIPFSLLFAMWFATGIVMHFVPYPNLTERERIEGLAPIGSSTAVQVAEGVNRIPLHHEQDHGKPDGAEDGDHQAGTGAGAALNPRT